jgi:hypothetical protein
MLRTRIPLVFVLLCLAAPLAAADKAAANAASFGVLTLVPPLVAIALAFLTRNVLLALFCGVFSGTLLLAVPVHGVAAALPQAFLDLVRRAQGAVADSWNAGILLQVFAIGGLIALMTRSGGLRAFAEKIATRATTPVGAQLAAWLLGFAVFFDDYANALIVGPAARRSPTGCGSRARSSPSSSTRRSTGGGDGAHLDLGGLRAGTAACGLHRNRLGRAGLGSAGPDFALPVLQHLHPALHPRRHPDAARIRADADGGATLPGDGRSTPPRRTPATGGRAGGG